MAYLIVLRLSVLNAFFKPLGKPKTQFQAKKINSKTTLQYILLPCYLYKLALEFNYNHGMFGLGQFLNAHFFQTIQSMLWAYLLIIQPTAFPISDLIIWVAVWEAIFLK